MPDPLNSFRARLSADLAELRARSQERSLVMADGISLCSNDYLGLADDDRLRQSVVEAVRSSQRVGSTGSRLLSGNTSAWESLEERFAAFLGTESSLYFGSGYAANLGLLGSLLDRDDIVFSDALNHASLIDGIRLAGCRKVIYPHCDLNALEDALRAHHNDPRRKLIVTETVFSMDGDIAPLAEIFALADRHGAEVVLDEAHAIGVFGLQGRGLAASSGLVDRALAIVCTCGKALASMGAFVCGPTIVRETLINHARTFIFSTAMPPYFTGQIEAALELATAADPQREHLHRISDRLRRRLADDGWNLGASASQIIPVILGSNESALLCAGQLQSDGFAVRAVRPPTVPEGTSRLRLSLTSKLTEADIDRLAASLARAKAAASPEPVAHV